MLKAPQDQWFSSSMYCLGHEIKYPVNKADRRSKRKVKRRYA